MTVEAPTRTRVGPPRPYPPGHRPRRQGPTEYRPAVLPDQAAAAPGEGDSADAGQVGGAVSLIHSDRPATIRDRSNERITSIITTSLWAAPVTLSVTIGAYAALDQLVFDTMPFQLAAGLYLIAVIATAATVGAVMAWREIRPPEVTT